MALHRLMKGDGGFEGNAQTLRLLAKIEKKIKAEESSHIGLGKNREDKRFGLNLTFRSLASVIKYDKCIEGNTDEIEKGYYKSESELVAQIKENVTAQKNYDGPFKTVECYIMDIADDIAYATYDLEDAFKGGFLTPFDLVEMEKSLAEKISSEINAKTILHTTADDVRNASTIFFSKIYLSPVLHEYAGKTTFGQSDIIKVAKRFFQSSKETAINGYYRTELTSRLVDYFINGVRIKINNDMPALSKVYLRRDIQLMVEILKRFIFEILINNSRIKITAYRGTEIVGEVFKSLHDTEKGYLLLPDDNRELYEGIGKCENKRILCDYVAGMTDRYALEFYGRLKSENPQTIFKPM